MLRAARWDEGNNNNSNNNNKKKQPKKKKTSVIANLEAVSNQQRGCRGVGWVAANSN